MYQLRVFDWFSAGHQLKGYQGKCEAVHGHNFKVEVTVSGNKLDKTGLIVDFKVLKKSLAEVLARLDHTLLNKLPPFQKKNPSAENIARYIYEKLSEKLPAKVKLVEVCIWESDQAGVSYQP